MACVTFVVVGWGGVGLRMGWHVVGFCIRVRHEFPLFVSSGTREFLFLRLGMLNGALAGALDCLLSLLCTWTTCRRFSLGYDLPLSHDQADTVTYF